MVLTSKHGHGRTFTRSVMAQKCRDLTKVDAKIQMFHGQLLCFSVSVNLQRGGRKRSCMAHSRSKLSITLVKAFITISGMAPALSESTLA